MVKSCLKGNFTQPVDIAIWMLLQTNQKNAKMTTITMMNAVKNFSKSQIFKICVLCANEFLITT